MAKRKNKNARKSTKTYQIVDVGGGGDCFYRVIAHQLGMEPKSFMKIRRKISLFIKSNKEKFLPFFESEEEFYNYVASIKKKGTWCEGEMEMQSVCDIYNVNLNVYADNGNITKFKSSRPQKTIRIYHDVDVHFRSIVNL